MYHFLVISEFKFESWWRHQMETFSALLAICAGNSPVHGEFPAQRSVTRGFDVFFDLRLNKLLSKQSRGWWFETLSRPLWRHRNGYSPETLKLGQHWRFLASCDLEISHMTFKNNRASLLCLCIISQPAVNIHLSYSPETLKLGQIWRFFASRDLKILRTTLKTKIGHLLYTHSTVMHHLVAIDEFQFELQSGNGQIGFWPLWPWPLTSDGQTDGRTDRRTGPFIDLLGCS